MAHTIARRSARSNSFINPIAFLVSGMAVWRQRRALSRLDAAARKDLGLSMQDVKIEAARPLWSL